MESTESTHTVRGFCALCTAMCDDCDCNDGKVTGSKPCDHPRGVFCSRVIRANCYNPDPDYRPSTRQKAIAIRAGNG